MKVSKLMEELEKFDPNGDVLFFDDKFFYRICNFRNEQGAQIYYTEIRKTYNIKIEKISV